MSAAIGRPPKYNEERVTTILNAISSGNTRKCAAGLAGVTETTLYEWAGEYPEFSEALEKADAEAEQGMVSRVKAAADDGTWTAAAWWLERRRNEEWGRKDTVKNEHSGSEEKPLRIVYVDDWRRSPPGAQG